MRMDTLLREQFDIGLIAVAAVFLLAGHLAQNAKVFERLDRCRGGREAGVESLACLFDAEAGHGRQHFKETIAGGPGLWRLQKMFAVLGDEAGDADDALFRFGRGICWANSGPRPETKWLYGCLINGLALSTREC